jgi:MFS transporter, NNP family, nitrate/nitrite transporter
MNKLRGFLKAGHFPTLMGAFFYFDISFMVWVMLGALGAVIAGEFNLTPAEKGFMVSVPLLGGTLLRIPMGILSDRYGSRRVAIVGQGITMIPLVWGYFAANTMSEIYALGALLGVAGASFAVALPLASRWYPPQYQGLVMGIAGAGNSGTVIATFFAPRLAKAFGWHAVFGLALVPMVIMAIAFFFMAKDAPRQTPPLAPLSLSRGGSGIWKYLAPIKSRDALLFSLFYSITFGGFVGLASFLPIFFTDQYKLDKITAGNCTALCVMAGSFVRPIGGYLADRFSGVTVLTGMYIIIAVLALGISMMPSLELALGLFVVLMLALGAGNGSVFQLVPLRFKNEVGVITGFVGAFGGLGGFLLPNLLGSLKGITQTYATGFVVFACLALSAAMLIFWINALVWRRNQWQTAEESA